MISRAEECFLKDLTVLQKRIGEGGAKASPANCELGVMTKTWHVQRHHRSAFQKNLPVPQALQSLSAKLGLFYCVVRIAKTMDS